jgi:hypothetical protein
MMGVTVLFLAVDHGEMFLLVMKNIGGLENRRWSEVD